MNRRIIPLIFLVFLFSGYVTMGYVRHFLYEERIREHITKWTKEVEYEKPMSWENHTYLGTPEGALVVADPVFKNEMYSLYEIHQDYSAEYQTEVLALLLGEFDGHSWNLWDAYETWVISLEIRYTFYFAMFPVTLGPDISEDWGGSLAESVVLWEAAGGKREGNWIEVYKHSPEYETWLNTKFEEISGPKKRTPPPELSSSEDEKEFLDLIDKKITELLSQGKSKDDPEVQSLLLAKKILQMKDPDRKEREEKFLIYRAYEPMSTEERYRAVKQPLDLPLSGRIFCSDILRVNQRMVEVAYERYLEHASEKDVIRAGIDAWVVEFAGDFYVTMGKLDHGTVRFLKMEEFPFDDFIIDACLIVGLSALFTFIIAKKGGRRKCQQEPDIGHT